MPTSVGPEPPSSERTTSPAHPYSIKLEDKTKRPTSAHAIKLTARLVATKDSQWVRSPLGYRLVVPRNATHARTVFERAKVTFGKGWDDVEIVRLDGTERDGGWIGVQPRSGKTIVVVVPVWEYSTDLASRLTDLEKEGKGRTSPEVRHLDPVVPVMVHRLVRETVAGGIESSLSPLQRGIFTDVNALKLVRRARVHYVEWAGVVMCDGRGQGCSKVGSELRCNGTLVLDEHAAFPSAEVKTRTEAREKRITVCVAGAPRSVMGFVRRGRALGHECQPLGAPEVESPDGSPSVLVTDLMTLRLQVMGYDDREGGSPGGNNTNLVAEDMSGGEENEQENGISCAFYDRAVTCPADVEMSFQEVLDWSGCYNLTRHGIVNGTVISFESMKSELDSMLANRHLAILVGLTVATYTIGDLVLMTFYATTAARLALDCITLDEILRVRSVRVLSWVGVMTMLRVHNTGVASALFGSGLLALGLLSTQVFQVTHSGPGRITVSAASSCLILGFGYGCSLILALWLASSLRLSCISNAGARRALYLLSDDLAFVNALAGSPLLRILDGMCDATPDELRAALGPRVVQYGSSKVLRPADSMKELNSDVEGIGRAGAVDILATSQVGHLVLDLDYRVGRADHGVYA
ncbi:hypothetical protein HKX48_003250 [Thoreauomyces humboldtii]|nr:hypothetical protein HKX48_003250 [Thoreauomyces humboldtii]